MINRIKEYFKTKHTYHYKMMNLSSSITGKIEQLLDAELARTKAETEAMEAAKEINSLFSHEDLSRYLEQISQFLTDMKHPEFQESFYQHILDAARREKEGS